MDDVYERCQVLEKELEQFNTSLNNSFEAVQRSHTKVSPLWDDSMRREYDRTWKPLEDAMIDYNRRTGPQYVQLLLERLRYLRSYLHGS